MLQYIILKKADLFLSVFSSKKMSVKVVFSFIISGVFSAYDYIYINSKKTFADANAYCKTEFGTSLAIIDTPQDNALIKSKITINGDVWIGINDLDTEGVFKNADGSSLSYTNWKTSYIFTIYYNI